MDAEGEAWMTVLLKLDVGGVCLEYIQFCCGLDVVCPSRVCVLEAGP